MNRYQSRGTGLVYLDIPGDILGQAMDAAAATDTVWRVVDPAPRQSPAQQAVDRALGVLAQARRPLIVHGQGAAYAQADNVIREFVETTGIPFLPMSMAKGLLPDSHRQSVAAARSLAIARGRGLVGRRPAELAARPWRAAAMVCRCQVHPG